MDTEKSISVWMVFELMLLVQGQNYQNIKTNS